MNRIEQEKAVKSLVLLTERPDLELVFGTWLVCWLAQEYQEGFRAGRFSECCGKCKSNPKDYEELEVKVPWF